MFDTNNNYSSEYIPYTKQVNVTVNENKAPTDESIRLYNELQDKAQKSVIDRRTIPNNIVKGEYYCISDFKSPWDWVIVFVFKVNDIVYEVEKRYSKKDYKESKDLYKIVEQQGTEIILEYILNEGFQHIVKDVYQEKFKQHIDNNTYKRLTNI